MCVCVSVHVSLVLLVLALCLYFSLEKGCKTAAEEKTVVCMCVRVGLLVCCRYCCHLTYPAGLSRCCWGTDHGFESKHLGFLTYAHPP
jgi:hypothetical protein